ncbi:hypothetical protein GUJ93_ZPchr0009g686 [Zizania palustris]|uniref:Uncharacterized protein n=1 Tax=Zizania palustris TaxID=103762 RepID=A0A8J5RQG6_ZIZPA|nr:hypothetical protein GUJ93_ZPchr0009g686 [Zizania palustris]
MLDYECTTLSLTHSHPSYMSRGSVWQTNFCEDERGDPTWDVEAGGWWLEAGLTVDQGRREDDNSGRFQREKASARGEAGQRPRVEEGGRQSDVEGGGWWREVAKGGGRQLEARLADDHGWREEADNPMWREEEDGGRMQRDPEYSNVAAAR